MTREKLLRSGEGLVVTALGLLFLLLSLAIPSNPVPVAGAARWLSEARALPLLLSAAVAVLGGVHTAALWRGRTAPVPPEGAPGWPALLILITVAYLAVTSVVGFPVPTAAYLAGMLLLCGRKENKPLPLLLGLAVLYAVLALWAIPSVLRLRLM